MREGTPQGEPKLNPGQHQSEPARCAPNGRPVLRPGRWRITRLRGVGGFRNGKGAVAADDHPQPRCRPGRFSFVVARRKVSRLYVTSGCEWESYGNDEPVIRSMESGSVRELMPAIPWLNAANTCPGLGARRQFPARHCQGQGRGRRVRHLPYRRAEWCGLSPRSGTRNGHAARPCPVAGQSNAFPDQKRSGSEVRRIGSRRA